MKELDLPDLGITVTRGTGVRTLRNLKAGLLDCLRFLKKKAGE